MNLWWVVLGMGLITFALRLALIEGAGRFGLPPRWQRALRYAPAAVLSAIILPEMVQPGGTLDLSLGNERLLAGLVAIAVAWFSRNMILTVVVGMLTLWLLQALG